MNRNEMKDKLDYIVSRYDTIVRLDGYKAATDIKAAYFFDVVTMLRLVLEEDSNGQQRSNLREVRKKDGSGSGSIGP